MSRRKREARERLTLIADAIGARDGEVIRDANTGGGLNGPIALILITIRPGTDTDSALSAQLERAIQVGYTGPVPYGEPHCGATFITPRTLPMLSVVVHAPSTDIPGGRGPSSTATVPPGHVGVVITLS
jgi:hypothetical protein